MPGSADKRGELFARALERELTTAPDEQLRRELAVVDLLVRAGRQTGPDGAERDRMRERILASLAEDDSDDVVVALGAARRRRAAALGLQGRLLIAAAAAMCLLVALSGMSLVLARDALPGDALYGVKRSAESAELGLTFGNARGFKHLQFATARVDELEALAARADNSGSPADAARYLTALQAFDVDAAAGTRLLVDTATSGGGDELATLRAWAEQQHVRLDNVSAVMPSKAGSRAGGSLALLDRVDERAIALQGRLRCLVVTSGSRDDLGLLPADGICEPAVGSTAPPTALTGPRSTADPSGPGGQSGQQSTAPVGPLDPGVRPSGQQPPAGQPPAQDPGQGTAPPSSQGQSITIPLPLPPITLPPLLPWLPGLQLG